MPQRKALCKPVCAANEELDSKSSRRPDRDETFYRAALEYAQPLTLEEEPLLENSSDTMAKSSSGYSYCAIDLPTSAHSHSGTGLRQIAASQCLDSTCYRGKVHDPLPVGIGEVPGCSNKRFRAGFRGFRHVYGMLRHPMSGTNGSPASAIFKRARQAMCCSREPGSRPMTRSRYTNSFAHVLLRHLSQRPRTLKRSRTTSTARRSGSLAKLATVACSQILRYCSIPSFNRF
jgi:hypothetical protein